MLSVNALVTLFEAFFKVFLLCRHTHTLTRKHCFIPTAHAHVGQQWMPKAFPVFTHTTIFLIQQS